MPRRTAAERHRDTAPGPAVREQLEAEGSAPLDALVAFHHPLRRRLFELLLLEGPAPVGTLAGRLGVAVGSVSHHLKPLHAQGFVEPAPELARDTRQSWWRARERRLSWSALDQETPAGRQVAAAAEQANLEHHIGRIRDWHAKRDRVDPAWEQAAVATDALTLATREQLGDLRERLLEVVETWARACHADAKADAQADAKADARADEQAQGDARADAAAERLPVFVCAYAVPVVR